VNVLWLSTLFLLLPPGCFGGQEEGQALVLALFQHLWLSEHLHRQANISLHGSSTFLGSKGHCSNHSQALANHSCFPCDSLGVLGAANVGAWKLSCCFGSFLLTGLGSQLAVAPTPAQAAALQATLARLSKLYSVVYGLVVTSVVKYVVTVGSLFVHCHMRRHEEPDFTPATFKVFSFSCPMASSRSKQAGPEYRNLTLAYLHHILTLSCIKLFQQLGKHDEDLPRSAPVDAYLAPVTGHQLVLHPGPFAERVRARAAVPMVHCGCFGCWSRVPCPGACAR
jgi:hypothetical protein